MASHAKRIGVLGVGFGSAVHVPVFRSEGRDIAAVYSRNEERARQSAEYLGVTRPAMVFPLVAGPIMAGLIFDATGEYDLAFLITIALLGVAIVAFLPTRPPTPAPGMTKPR